jgi:predicted ATPase
VDQQRKPRIDVAFADVGFGISQMLPIIVQAAGSKNRIISIEQPEVHIHPRLQAEVGNLLAECAKENQNQFLVETHSEHLVLRLRRLVREKKLAPEDVTVIHIRRGPNGSIVEQIGINEDGTFNQEWPGGFFPERMKELL